MSSIPWSISEDSFDVNFSVPQVLRLRFTRDCFGADWDQIVPWFRSDSGSARVQVWVDRGVADANPRLLPNLQARIQEHSPQLELVSPIQCIDGGEQIKNGEETVNHLFRSIDRDGLDRRSYIVAIGGGAVLDAVGYAAAISHRGIRLVRFPTTTLAQADSGVGVKNAINAFGKKNWKGTFAVPWGVVNDQSLIAHLPDRDFRAGFSEAVKVSLLKSPSAFRFLCQHASDIARRDWTAVMPAIRSSVLMHLHHITHGGDPFEMQEARPLDFGHWSAHKLEQLTRYQLRHGEAVSIGVALDTLYSHLVLGLDRADALNAVQALLDLGLPIYDSNLETTQIFDGLEEFRQHLGGRLTLTMLRGVGSAVSVHEVDAAGMSRAISMLRSLHEESEAKRAANAAHLASENASIGVQE
ncbi:MAG: 3-dehydroquinate synthase [Planctomycetota bacterium]|jgi:3-dehydroquinate synthase